MFLSLLLISIATSGVEPEKVLLLFTFQMSWFFAAIFTGKSFVAPVSDLSVIVTLASALLIFATVTFVCTPVAVDPSAKYHALDSAGAPVTFADPLTP